MRKDKVSNYIIHLKCRPLHVLIRKILVAIDTIIVANDELKWQDATLQDEQYPDCTGIHSLGDLYGRKGKYKRGHECTGLRSRSGPVHSQKEVKAFT